MCIIVLKYKAIGLHCARIGKMGLLYNCRKTGVKQVPNLTEAVVSTETQDLFLAIDFLGVFFSVLKKKNRNVVSSKQLFDTVGKHCAEFPDLFLDIDIRDNCGVYFSQDIEEGITMLQILGAVSKANPRYEKIILKLDRDSVDDILEKCDEKILKRINEFTEIFLRENNN